MGEMAAGTISGGGDMMASQQEVAQILKVVQRHLITPRDVHKLAKDLNQISGSPQLKKLLGQLEQVARDAEIEYKTAWEAHYGKGSWDGLTPDGTPFGGGGYE